MSIYFVQHGKCVAKEVDPDRPLSDEGRKEVERVAARLHKAGTALGQICHSGKTRARQTAEIMAGQLGVDWIIECAGMKPNDDAAEFAARLEDNSMYVGHLPHLARLVSCLTADGEETEVVRFTNAGVVCVGRDDNGWYVEWYLTPSLCFE